MLAGAVEIEAGAVSRRLKTGETARYAADAPHAIRNAGRGEAKALLVVIHR